MKAKMFSIVITIFVFLVSCVEDRKAVFDSYNTESIPLLLEDDSLYTTDLKYYKSILESNLRHVGHFPHKLNNAHHYSFFYMPPIMQGGVTLALKIDFESEAEALEYFDLYSRNYKKEFDRMSAYNVSDYCSVSVDNLKLVYQEEMIDHIRILSPVLCSGKNLKGGISSSIFIDKTNKSVICFMRSVRL